jgi:hypothetical protein
MKDLLVFVLILLIIGLALYMDAKAGMGPTGVKLPKGMF